MSRSVLLCACVLVLLTISAPQMEVNLPVRQVVMERGLLQGQCPSSASGSGRMPASGIPSGDVSASGLPQAQSGSASGTGASAGGSASGSVSGTGASPGGSASGSVSGTGASAGGSASGSVSGTGASAGGSASGSVSGTGASAGGSASGSVSGTGASAGGSASGSVSGTGASAGGSASGSVSGTGASAGGSASGSASGTGASGFPRAQSGSSGSPESSGSGVPVVFRNRRNAEGSTVNASGSGSGDICSNAFEILGPFCTRVLEAQFCQFNFSLQTCNFCANLSSSCGQPMGSISTLCASQNANSCSQSAGICLVQTADSMVCDYRAFVGSMCYQGREFELCSVNGLVDGCTNVLRGSYECECFLPSSQCSFCRNLIRVCATTIPPNAVVDVDDLTPEQADNAATIIFGGITVMQFNVVELQFRQGVADVANQYALSGPQPVRQRRQATVAQNVTANNVFIVGPSPLILNSNLNVVFFVQTDSGTIVNGTELTAAVQNEGATLAQEIGAMVFIGAFVGLPSGFGRTNQSTVQPTIVLTLSVTSAVSTLVLQPTLQLTQVVSSSLLPTLAVQPSSSLTQSLPSPTTTSLPTQAVSPLASPTTSVQQSSSLTQAVSPSLLPTSPTQAVLPLVSTTTIVQPSSSLTQAIQPSLTLASPTPAVSPLVSPTMTVPPSSSPTQAVPPSLPPTSPTQAVPQSLPPTSPTQAVPQSLPPTSPTQAVPPSLPPSPTQAVAPLVSQTTTMQLSSSLTQAGLLPFSTEAVQPSSSSMQVLVPFISPTESVQRSVPLVQPSLQPTQQPTARVATETLRPTLSTTSPTETAVPTEPTGRLSGGEIAAIVIVVIIVAVVILLLLGAVGVYFTQKRRKRYIFRTSPSPNDYGTYVTDTNTFGRPPKATNQDLVTSIPMETKGDTLPITSIVAANPVALEMGDSNDKDTPMVDESEKSEGGTNQGEQVSKVEVDESNKDTHL